MPCAMSSRDLSARRQRADRAHRSLVMWLMTTRTCGSRRMAPPLGRPVQSPKMASFGSLVIRAIPTRPDPLPSSPKSSVKLRALPGHVFWPDDVSLVGSADVDFSKILTSAQVTDAYLLALAKAHGGRLASFDRKLSTAAVKHGKATLHLIEPGDVRPGPGFVDADQSRSIPPEASAARLIILKQACSDPRKEKTAPRRLAAPPAVRDRPQCHKARRGTLAR